MTHLLDNPAWKALATGNSALGFLGKTSAYFQPEISPFVALAEPSRSCLLDLYETLPFDDTVILVSSQQMEIAGPWELIAPIRGFQMVYEGTGFSELDQSTELTSLTEEHVPQMLSLTKLTNPGPFLNKTIDFGHYEGIFRGSQLVAMAGQRMNPVGFAEVSAVCTHPAYLGQGYAKTLMQHQVNRILNAGEVPFLHVKSDNERAIKIYEFLGFKIRTEIFFIVMKKSS